MSDINEENDKKNHTPNKFKSGDRVGVGMKSTGGGYRAIGTGTVGEPMDYYNHVKFDQKNKVLGDSHQFHNGGKNHNTSRDDGDQFKLYGMDSYKKLNKAIFETNLDVKKQLEAIQEAYTQTICEKVETKFKVGDKVGVGSFGTNNPMAYSPNDTGTVTKTEKGVHHVTFDNILDRSSHFPADHKPLVHRFDGAGNSTLQKSIRMIPIEDHDAMVKKIDDDSIRNRDLSTVVDHLTTSRNGHGAFPKLSKQHVDVIKALLDKHTEE